MIAAAKKQLKSNKATAIYGFYVPFIAFPIGIIGLIDDYIKNINEWKANGGIGVHHTSPMGTLAELKRLGFK